MEYQFNIKLTMDELNVILSALEKMPMGEVLDVTKSIANQISQQESQAAEFDFDMEDFASKWKPTPASGMSFSEFLQSVSEGMKKDSKPKNPKKHWTQTPAGKAKLAARKKARK